MCGFSFLALLYPGLASVKPKRAKKHRFENGRALSSWPFCCRYDRNNATVADAGTYDQALDTAEGDTAAAAYKVGWVL